MTCAGGDDVLRGCDDENKLYGGAGNDSLTITAQEFAMPICLLRKG